MTLLEPAAARIALPASLLEGVVARVVEAVPTEVIYVFGSYARGESRDDSDVDFYVVTSDGQRSQMADTVAVRGAISEELLRRQLEFDVLSCPRRRFEAARGVVGLVEHAVGEEGAVIYDRAA